MTKTAAILPILLIVFACSTEKELQIEQVQIVTKNPEVLAEWYTSNFGFESIKNELVYDGFKIQLKKNEEAADTEILKEAFQVEQIPGFYKLGFVTNRFDELVTTLKEKGVKFASDVVYNEHLKRKYFLLKDPDGNILQIFEGSGEYGFKPFYIGVIVESIGEQEKWYQMKFPIIKTHNLDLPQQNVFVRLLEGDHFFIELINTSSKLTKKTMDKHERLGITSIKISGANARFEKDHEGNLIVHE